MRFMVIVKSDKNTEAGVLPSRELLEAMTKYNEELVRAGIMLAGEGLQPSSKGARVKFSGSQRTVVDGPFTETKELIAGFWLWQVKGLAEDLAQDALVAALEHWPAAGVPEKPGAWLMATAKRRAIDQLRRKRMLERKHEQLGREHDAHQERAGLEAEARLDAAMDDDIGDDLLRLVFITCHPVLSTEARVALTLRLLGGLTTEEIARAFLTPVATVAQRIVRAKRTLAEARVPFET